MDEFCVGEKVKIKSASAQSKAKTGTILRKGAQVVPGKQGWMVSLNTTKKEVLCFEDEIEPA